MKSLHFERQTWYVFTHPWILDTKQKIASLQSSAWGQEARRTLRETFIDPTRKGSRRDLLCNWHSGGGRKEVKELGRRKGEHARLGSLSEWRPERESKERDTLKEGSTVGWTRSQALGTDTPKKPPLPQHNLQGRQVWVKCFVDGLVSQSHHWEPYVVTEDGWFSLHSLDY